MKLPLGLVATLLVGGCEDEMTPLRLGAPIEEPAPTVAETLVTSLRDAGIDVSVTFFEHGDEISEALAARTLDLALIEEPVAPLRDVATILPLYPSVLHVLRRSRQSLTIPEILEGKIYAGPAGSFARRLAVQLADDFGIDRIRFLDDPWTDSPDTYFVFGGLLPRDALRQLSGFSLVDLAPKPHRAGESVVDALALRYPNLRAFIVPAELYPTLSHEPIRTLAVTTLLVAGPGVAEDTAYRITQRLVEHARPMREAYPLAGTTSLETMDFNGFALPLHRGARRYVERDQPEFFERYVDIIALVTTLALAAASGLAGWAHRRRRARKDRIDGYLSAALDVRSSAPADWRARLDRIERDVLQLVVNEKIEVDAGLIAFLQVCASVRSELHATPRQA